jgi:DNA ligase (NAD+)
MNMNVNVKMELNEIIKMPKSFATKTPLPQLISFIKKCIKHYELEDPIIPDHIYDEIIDILKERDPKNSILTDIGFEEECSNGKVKLPFHMGSMTKIKDSDRIKLWLQKYRGPDYIISGKLDGASALLEQKDGIIKLYSRGNGTHGRDISHLLECMDLPNIKKTVNYCVRGELIVSKQTFGNFSHLYSNARSMVNGVMGRKQIDSEQIKALDLVIFELIYLNNSQEYLCAEKQLMICSKLGFNVCKFQKNSFKELSHFGQDAKLESSFILKTLLNFRIETEYDIDGIIITDNNLFKRNQDGNPDYSFAFKSNGVGEISKVQNVEWNISKHGYLIPRIKVEPISIDGVTIQYATGFNGKFIVDNHIGYESELRIVRSGDVIPYVIEIIKKSTKPIMPKDNYYWNESKVNILLKDYKNNKVLNDKKILTFFQTLGFENMSSGIIHKLIDYDYDTIKKILLISKEELLSFEGIQITMATKLYKNIHKIIDNPIDLAHLMAASLCFGHGFGIKKFNSIIETYPNILTINVSLDMLNTINGFSDKTSKKFIDNIDCFKLFMNELDFINIKNITSITKKKLKIVGGLFEHQKILFTGFRDERIMEFIIKHNGTIINAIHKKLNLLIVKDTKYINSKTEAAQLLGIPILTKEQFIEKYFNHM